MTISSRIFSIFFYVSIIVIVGNHLHACLSKHRPDNEKDLNYITCNRLVEMIRANQGDTYDDNGIEGSLQKDFKTHDLPILTIPQETPEQIKEKISQLLTIIACNKMQRTILNDHTKPVKIICFSPTRSDFASANEDNIIKVWDLNQKICTATLLRDSNQSDKVTALCFSHCGTMLAIGLERGCFDRACIEIWQCNNPTNEWAFLDTYHHVHDDLITKLCFSPDGTLASGSWDHSIKILHIKQGKLVLKASLYGHTGVIKSFCFYGNDMLASSSWNYFESSIKIWNKRDFWGNSDRWKCSHSLESDVLYSKSEVFKFDEKSLFYYLEDKINVWDLHNQTHKIMMNGLDFLSIIHLCADDAILNFGNKLALWEPTDTGYKNALADNPIKDFCCCTAPACFSQDGKILAYADLCSGQITMLNLSGLLAVRRLLKHPIQYDLKAHLALFTDNINFMFPEVTFNFLPDEIKRLVLGL